MLPILNTIHRPDKVYPTAGNPMLVTCDDLNYWVCKHSRDSSKLRNEVLASSFAKIWNLNTPEISLIKVNKEHVPHGVQGVNFNKLCFGSKYIQSSQEVNDTILAMFKDVNFRNKIANKNDFLMIAFFDIWLSNEDRNHNNSNLLIDFSDSNEIHFTVFDHDAIFNSNSLHRELFPINNFESLIDTQLANILFKRGRNLVKVVDNLVEKFYLCTKECEDSIKKIVGLMPLEWGVDSDSLEKELEKKLFSREWLNTCEKNFRTLIQENIK